jgi:phosphatidylglycerol:prolipoprotein diacylglycerol transferase
MTRDQLDDLILWLTVGIIVGGRLGSMIFYNTSALWQRPLEIFKIWEGGMSFHGGLLGVMLAMLLFARFQKVSVLAVSDLVSPCVPIGLFFGRIANFINGELWGRETDLPWAFYVGDDSPLPRHPSQLYEAFLEGIVLFVVLRLATHRWGYLKKPGAATGLFLAGYGVFRILVEFVREPDSNLANLPLGLTMGMILSIPMVIAGAYLLRRAYAAPLLTVGDATPPPKAQAETAKPKPKAKAKTAPKSAASAKPRAARPKAK